MKSTHAVLLCGVALAIGLMLGTQYRTQPVSAAPTAPPMAGLSFALRADAPCTVRFMDQFEMTTYQEAEIGPEQDGEVRLTPPLFDGMVISVVADDRGQPLESADR